MKTTTTLSWTMLLGFLMATLGTQASPVQWGEVRKQSSPPPPTPPQHRRLGALDDADDWSADVSLPLPRPRKSLNEPTRFGRFAADAHKVSALDTAIFGYYLANIAPDSAWRSSGDVLEIDQTLTAHPTLKAGVGSIFALTSTAVSLGISAQKMTVDDVTRFLAFAAYNVLEVDLGLAIHYEVNHAGGSSSPSSHKYTSIPEIKEAQMAIRDELFAYMDGVGGIPSGSVTYEFVKGACESAVQYEDPSAEEVKETTDGLSGIPVGPAPPSSNPDESSVDEGDTDVDEEEEDKPSPKMSRASSAPPKYTLYDRHHMRVDEEYDKETLDRILA